MALGGVVPCNECCGSHTADEVEYGSIGMAYAMPLMLWHSHMGCLAPCGAGQERYSALYGAGKRNALHCVVPTGALQCILWREATRCHALSGASRSSAVPSMARVSAPLHTLWLACALLDSMAFDNRKDAMVGALPQTLWR